MLEKVRLEINQIDDELVQLLEKRYSCVDEVIRIKKEEDMPVLDASRENSVLERVRGEIKNKAYEESIVKTFQTIMAISREYQHLKK